MCLLYKNFNIKMLEYSKLILRKVSFDCTLFEKELKKSLNYLLTDEIEELFNWAKTHHQEYSGIINAVQDLFSSN